MGMELLVERVDVWAASIEDRPGGLAEVLAALREAGADLQFIIARRAPEAPGKPYNLLFMLHGAVQHAAYHGGQIALLRRLQQ